MTNFKELLKKDFGLYYNLKSVIKDKKARNKFLAGIFGIAIIIFYLYIAQVSLLNIYDTFLLSGMAEELIIYAQFIFLFLILVFFTTTIISRFYYSNDIKILLRLPIKSEDIMASRIIFYAVNSLFYGILLSFPIILKTGIYLKKSILFYILSIIVLLLVSLILINIVTLVVVYIMKFINKSAKMKNILKYTGYVLFFIIIFFLQISLQTFANNLNEQVIISNAPNFKNYFSNIFPQIKLATNILLSENIITVLFNFILLVFVGFATTFITVKFGNKVLVSGILNANISKSKKIKLSKADSENTSVLKLIYRKEIKNIFGNAVYLINKITSGIIFTIAFTVPFISKSDFSFFEQINNINNKIYAIENGYLLLITGAITIVMILTLFISSGSELTSTTFGREGKNIWLMKALPIKARDQLLGRIFASCTIIILSSLPLILLINVITKFNPFIIIGSIVSMSIISFFSSNLTLIPGILWPKVNWDNPSQAIKGGRTILPALGLVFISIVVSLVAFIPLGIDFKFYSKYLYLHPIVWHLLFLVLGYLLYKLNLKLYKKHLIKMGN